jgi:hypothetical protein
MEPPESVYEEAATIPLSAQHLPYTGTVDIPIVIHKDGSIKISEANFGWRPQDLCDALALAVKNWKYKPYLIDGHPVEVSTYIHYNLDERPFVPSYKKPKAAAVGTAPDDFTSAYDPKRDPVKDFELAKAAAATAHKHILVEVGGDWCVWCKTMDRFFADHADLRAQRDAAYIVMKVNMSGLNENHVFLDRYPKIPGYPFLFVFDADGKLLKSEDTSPLENKVNNYDAKEVKDFLAAWGPR